MQLLGCGVQKDLCLRARDYAALPQQTPHKRGQTFRIAHYTAALFTGLEYQHCNYLHMLYRMRGGM